jgi:hypothetical protein
VHDIENGFEIQGWTGKCYAQHTLIVVLAIFANYGQAIKWDGRTCSDEQRDYKKTTFDKQLFS